MNWRNKLVRGLPTTKWEERSLLNWAVGAFIRLALIVAILYGAALLITVINDGPDAVLAPAWTRKSLSFLAPAAFGLLAFFLYMFVGEAVRRRSKGSRRPPES